MIVMQIFSSYWPYYLFLKLNAMIAIAELKNQILQLPKHDFAKLRQWMLELDEAQWDAQIAADSTAGKLDFLVARARQEMASGQSGRL